jgi:hypothetical protein
VVNLTDKDAKDGTSLMRQLKALNLASGVRRLSVATPKERHALNLHSHKLQLVGLLIEISCIIVLGCEVDRESPEDCGVHALENPLSAMSAKCTESGSRTILSW